MLAGPHLPPEDRVPPEITATFSDLQKLEAAGKLRVEYKVYGATDKGTTLNLDLALPGEAEPREISLEAPTFEELRQKFLEYLENELPKAD